MLTSNLVPMVIDRHGNHERAFDIYSLLLKERIIFLSGPINQSLAGVVVAQLLYLNSVNPELPIHLYIQSGGGEVYAGLAIFDTMQMIDAPVATCAIGFTGSMSTILLCAGEKGRRMALPHATIHMHPAGGGSKGYTEDVRIATHEQERIQAQLSHLMGQRTGHDWKEIEEFFRRDRYLNAIEAREYGIVDEVMGDLSTLIRLDKKPLDIQWYSQSNSPEPPA